jgi:hypothetical protein
MSTISSQLRKLRKNIYVPWRMKIVDRVIEPHEFEEKIIYVHIWIKETS